ncbi:MULTISPECIES: CHAP domain-containing protein [Enterococcus]|uniref:CHAP domain-containing protein n=1 Tax=Enterococcus TaxID=1350 RepID=UPI0028215142|nr:CHAP domain-containing protein [Enterococcus faecalis]HDV4126239.1 CHAP domain-containing protein [Enterococcus faecalis]
MKKRKRDFSERQKGKEEAKTLGKELQSEEAIKLKHGDDYRSKIIHESNRFQDKVSDKESKLDYGEENKGSKRQRSKVKSNHETIKTSSETSSDYLTDVKNGKIYDPLSQDLDNDGIADRYDNNFRDSDYFESTYDVDKKEVNRSLSSKKSYKKKNYQEDLFTRKKKEDIPSRDKKKSQKKKALYEAEKGKGINQKGMALFGAAKGSELVRDYLSHGSDENQGVESGEKIADTSSKLVHKMRSYSHKKKNHRGYELSKRDYQLRKKKSKLEFRDAKEELKKTEEYAKSSAYRKFQKRKQMKASIRKQNHSRLRDRIKDSFLQVVKGTKKALLRKLKGLMIIVIGLIILGTFLIQFGGSSMSGLMNTSSTVLTTTYLSSETVLKEINNRFSSMENELYNEMENVKSNHPGYDEYIIHKNGDIGHNVHELLSYITARCGEVKNADEVDAILKELFDEMYQLDYKEEVEIRYRTVEESYVDENGEVQIRTVREPYEYKKLIITLNKKEMDSVVREVFRDYPDNLTHYESLFSTQGNMKEVFGNSDLIAANGGTIGGGREYEVSADVQKRIVNAAYMTPSPGPGWCAMWVSQVYQNAGLGYIGGNANDMYRNLTFTSDPSKLKVGMIVAVESSSSGGAMGIQYGHVGIYIGDGKVMDNIGVVRVTTLDDWIATFCQHHPVGFGFPPSVQP